MIDTIDLKSQTVDEISSKMLDSFRIANEVEGLESKAPSEEAIKVLEAIRKAAKEDPIAIADALLSVSLNMYEIEAELTRADSLLDQLTNEIEQVVGGLEDLVLTEAEGV